MLKKILLFIGLFASIIISFSNLSAENLILKPLKKPSLSVEEITKKISKNILKPIKKPIKSKIINRFIFCFFCNSKRCAPLTFFHF